MFKCSCCRMKCDEGSDAWNNFRISHIHVFLKNLGQPVPRKKNMEFAKVRRKNFFLAKMRFSRWKNLERMCICIYIHIHIWAHCHTLVTLKALIFIVYPWTCLHLAPRHLTGAKYPWDSEKKGTFLGRIFRMYQFLEENKSWVGIRRKKHEKNIKIIKPPSSEQIFPTVEQS